MTTMKADTKKLLFAVVCVYASILIMRILTPVVTMLFSNFFARSLAAEIVLTVFAAISLVLVKKTDVLRFRVKGLGNGFLVGGSILAVNALIILLFFLKHEPITATAAEKLMFVVNMLLIGVAEEVLFRGVLQNAALDYTGRDNVSSARKGILLAGVLFGLTHLINFFSGVGLVSVLIQAVADIAMGVMFGVVYFRCGNLWAPIILHAIVDFCSFADSGVLSGVTMTDAVNEFGNSIGLKIAGVAIYVALAAFCMRKSKMEKAIAEHC